MTKRYEDQTVKELKKLLHGMNLTVVAKETGISYHPLWWFTRGRVPTEEMVSRLNEFFSKRGEK